MAELSADTSSYPKPQLPVSPLDMAGKLGSLQQQSLQINQQKMDQANQGLQYISRALTSLGPNASKEDLMRVGQDTVKLGLVPPQALQVWNERLNSAASPQQFIQETLHAADEHTQALEWHQGQNGLLNRGSDVVPVNTRPGMAPRQTGMPIPVGTSPEFNQAPKEIYDPKTGKVVQGVQGQYTTNAGVKPLSNNLYGQPALPVAPPNVNAAANAPAALPMDAGANVAQYAKDKADAPALLDQIKPIAQALPIIQRIGKTGIGTEEVQKGLAALANLGFINPSKDGNYSVDWQILNKKLEQFVNQAGSDSDKKLAQTAASNPNAKTQLMPALLHLAQDAIATNRMKAERVMSYSGAQPEYLSYAAKRAAEQHPDAYKLDTYPEEERQKIYAAQLKAAQSKEDTSARRQARRFITSLGAAEKAGVTHEGP